MNPAFQQDQAVLAWNKTFYDRGVVKSVRFDEGIQSWRYIVRCFAGYEVDVEEIFVQAIDTKSEQ